MFSKNQLSEVYTLAAPLAQWLTENANPHVHLVIHVDSIEVLSAEIGIPLKSGQRES